MITDRIGRQKVLLPVHHNKNKIREKHKIFSSFFSFLDVKTNKETNQKQEPIKVLLQRPMQARRITVTVLLRCHVHTLDESEEAGKTKNKTS